MAKTMLERFEEKYIKVESGCWEWTATKHERGYGYFHTSRDYSPRKMDYAHRVSLFLYEGLRDDEKVVLHRCDNTSCVNPTHLSLGSMLDNTTDMMEKGRYISSAQKVTKEQVEEMIKLRGQGVMGKDIAKQFNMSRSHVSRLTRGFRKHYN